MKHVSCVNGVRFEFFDFWGLRDNQRYSSISGYTNSILEKPLLLDQRRTLLLYHSEALFNQVRCVRTRHAPRQPNGSAMARQREKAQTNSVTVWARVKFLVFLKSCLCNHLYCLSNHISHAFQYRFNARSSIRAKLCVQLNADSYYFK
jgi:hypothetical protein